MGTETKRYRMNIQITGNATKEFEWDGDEEPTNEEAWEILMESEGPQEDAHLLEWSYEEVTSVEEAK